MGFMTNITFLNDHFDWIEKNPKKFVRAIRIGMNSGTESPLTEAIDAKHGGHPSHWHESKEEREARIHYVTVHKAQHMDDPQLIYTEANSAWPVHELPHAIGLGWLDTKSNPDTYIGILRRVANKLRWYADQLDAELDAAEEN